MELFPNSEANNHQNTSMEAIQGEHQGVDDRISNLPDDLAQHIMSLLPMKDVARTAVLSKRWESLWLSYPIHEFDERWFKEPRHLRRIRFHEYLKRSLTARDFNNVQELKIITLSQSDYELEHIIARYVAKAMLRGKLKKLDLQVRDQTSPVLCDHCVFPRVVFASGSCLVSLVLGHYKIGAYQKVSFPSLTNLKLIFVHVSNLQLERVIQNIPQLETLALEHCHGFTTLKVFNPNVRSLLVKGCCSLTEIEMDAPSLKYLKFCGSVDHTDVYVYDPEEFCCESFEFKVAKGNSMPSLETLVISFMELNDGVLESMLSKFPNLETMKLYSTAFGKMPPSSTLSGKLKLVEVQNCRFSGPLVINSPNLETLVYKAGRGQCDSMHFGGRGFPNIKTLSVIGLRNESLEELLSCCILLENLFLVSCGNQQGRHLDIYNSKLKSLVVHGCDNLHIGEIQAPQLVYFRYVGRFEQFSTIYFEPCCDLDAELHLVSKPFEDIDYAQVINLKKLLRNVDQTRILTIISNSAERVADSFPPQLVSQPHPCIFDILLGILSIPVCHETLRISFGDTYIELKFKPSKLDVSIVRGNAGIIFKPHMTVLRYANFGAATQDHKDCIQHHLTEVRLENFDGNANQMKLLTHFLQRACLLELMSIFPKESHQVQQAPIDYSEIINMITNYPLASQSAKIVFNGNVIRSFLHYYYY